MVRIVQAAVRERERVVFLVEDLLAKMEESPEELEGIDRAKALRDLAGAGDRYTASLAPATYPGVLKGTTAGESARKR